MQRAGTGFTLLEVMIATVVVTVGLLALASSIGVAASLGGQGRAQARAALLLSSRADMLRQQVLAARPGCIAPGGGFRALSPGVVERWSGAESGGVIELVVVVGADTLVTRVACQ